MTDFDPASYAHVGPAEFAGMVKSTPRPQLQTLLAGEDRAVILGAIFERIPGQLRADRAGSLETVIHWNLTGRSDGGTDSYEVMISNGVCTVGNVATADPKVAFTLDAVDFLHMIAGVANPMVLFMTGKVKVKGDVALAANVANLFDLPKG